MMAKKSLIDKVLSQLVSVPGLVVPGAAWMLKGAAEAEAAVVRLSMASGVSPDEAADAKRACVELAAAEPGRDAFNQLTGWDQPLQLLEAVTLGVCGGLRIDKSLAIVKRALGERRDPGGAVARELALHAAGAVPSVEEIELATADLYAANHPGVAITAWSMADDSPYESERFDSLAEQAKRVEYFGIWLNHPLQREWLQGAGGAWYTTNRKVAERRLDIVNPLAAGMASIGVLPADVARADVPESASTWTSLDEALHAAPLVPSDEEREALKAAGLTPLPFAKIETTVGVAPELPDAGAGLEYGRAVKAKLAQLARDAGWSAHRAMEAKIDRAKIPDGTKALFEPFDSTPGVIPQAAGFTPINPAAYATPELIPVESFYPVPSCDVRPDVINHLTARYTDDAGAHIVGLAPLSDPPTDDELVALADRLGDDGGQRIYDLLFARGCRVRR